jgi:hypothetical protein
VCNFQRSKLGKCDGRVDWLATLETVFCIGRKLSAALGACQRELASTLQAEFCLQRILMLTARTLHVEASTCLISGNEEWTTELSPRRLTGQVAKVLNTVR